MNNQMEELAVDLKITRFFSSIQFTFTKPIKQPFPLQFGAAINLSSGTILHSHNNQEMLQLCPNSRLHVPVKTHARDSITEMCG
jgi:hypothetical protein